MFCTSALHSRVSRGGLVLVALVAMAAATVFDMAPTQASDSMTRSGGQEEPAAPQAEGDDKDPEANLPFLFAVFFTTWAVFFAYVFLMSRRQREMRQEIEALRRSLAERDRLAEPEAEPPRSLTIRPRTGPHKDDGGVRPSVTGDTAVPRARCPR